MAENALMVVHAGGQRCTRDEVQAVELPPATATWHPVRHVDVLDKSVETLRLSGFDVAREQYCLAREGRRFFATLDLESSICPGVSLAVGLRNSIDKSFPMGFCAGTRVFVCDNLAFSSEINVRVKHTRYGHNRYVEGIYQAVGKLAAHRQAETIRVERMMDATINDNRALSLIVQAIERGVLPLARLPEVVHEWREPRHMEFTPRTAWSLHNAFTEVMKATSPGSLPMRTIALTNLLSLAI